MKGRMIRVCLCIGFMLPGIVTTAWESAVSLLRTYKAGEISRYKSTITANLMGTEVVVTQTIKEEVKEVKENGHAVIVSTNEGGKVSANGQEQEIPSTPPITTTRDRLGKLMDFKKEQSPQGLTSPEVERLMTALSDTLFTDKPVKAGDTWQIEIDNPVVKEKKVVVKGAFLGTEALDGRDLWKVKQSGEADIDSNGAKMSYEFTAWLNPANGQPVKVEGSVKDLPTQFGPLSMKVVMTLLPAEENAKK
jgi:hypothetical protein